MKLEPRSITIHEITNVNYEYPKVTFTSEVSSGTYIRSLARDIGEKLGVGAYMSDLRRTKVGGFDLLSAISTTELTIESIRNNLIDKK